ncbi:MAG: crotonase/enoyl-CoA hydratase family protein [Deltaproteobacteria bacterium]|nr:crotonase/enoyl-CoA hydratase family protein [Deltaproteobacteria bacterium]
MSYACFEIEIQDHIAHLRLNRPDEMNMMNLAFFNELPIALKELDDQAAARVLVISSTGKHFTAGMELSVFSGLQGLATANAPQQRERTREVIRAWQQGFNMIEKMRIPVIAAVQGGCIGGGVDMTSACDMRFCTADAFFCIQEINIAITADVGTLQRLPHLIPSGKMRELAYTGRRMFADEAEKIGLVNQVYDTHEAMMEGVMGIAREIAKRSPMAVCGSKEIINYTRDHSVADSLNYVAVWQSGMADFTEVMETFAAKGEKREPVYKDLSPSINLDHSK